MSGAIEAMREERDFLLASLGDLELEYVAGDLDDDDYQQLKSDYTVRAADLIRSIEGVGQIHSMDTGPKTSGSSKVAGSKAAGPKDQKAKVGNSVARLIATAVGLLAFAVGAGWLLAQAVGERGGVGRFDRCSPGNAARKSLDLPAVHGIG